MDVSDPGLAAALAAGGIHHRVPGADFRSALKAAAERLPLSAEERVEAARLLLERETGGSTALGDGIAVPHPKNPLVFPVASPRVALCLLERPVDFGAADGGAVRALFIPLAGTVREHLALLSQLAAALRRPGFKEAVLRQAPAADILAALGEG